MAVRLSLRAYVAAGTVACIVYLVVPHSAWSEVLFQLASVAAIVAIATGVLRHRPERVEAWLLLAAGVAMSLAGDLTWFVLSSTERETLLSIADGLYVAAYPLLILGLWRLVSDGFAVRDRTEMLDAVIVALAIVLLAWVLVVHPLVGENDLPLVDRLWGLVYPVCDLALLLVTVRLVFAPGRRAMSAWLLVGGFAVWFLADIAYSWTSSQDAYGPGGAIDTAWMVAYLLVGAAALHPSIADVDAGDDGPRSVGLPRIVILAAAGAVPPVVILVEHWLLDGDEAVTQIAALAGLAMILPLAMRSWGLVVTARDLAERRGLARFEAMVENSADVIVLVDREMTVVYVSSSIRALSGRTPGECVDRRLTDLLESTPGEDRVEVGRIVGQVAAVEIGSTRRLAASIHHVDGTARDLELVAANLLDDPDVGGIVVTLRDVTAERSLERTLRHRATHDPLTGLANRQLFQERVEAALERWSPGAADAHADGHDGADGMVAVLFVDLDDFKAINDGLGHAVGDAYLQGASARLRQCVEPSDTVARLGGDEFAILLEGARSVEDVVSMARGVLRVLEGAIPVGELQLSATGSIGIVVADEATTTADLLHDADIAMYEAKGAGKGCIRVFDPAMRRSRAAGTAVKSELGGALARGELAVVYQPIVELRTGLITGAEALLRWHHPEWGDVPRDDFVPLAEDGGAMTAIGRWVLDQACVAAARWPANGAAEPGVSVNVSGSQFTSVPFVDDVRAALSGSGLAGHRLTIEITEDVLLADLATSWRVLDELRALGVRVALDDFGAGPCSVSYLRQLPIDVVKVDVDVVGLLDSATDGAVARTILALASVLGLPTVAEGVERPEQALALHELGCTEGQGFLLARPMPIEELMALGPSIDPAAAGALPA